MHSLTSKRRSFLQPCNTITRFSHSIVDPFRTKYLRFGNEVTIAVASSFPTYILGANSIMKLLQWRLIWARISSMLCLLPSDNISRFFHLLISFGIIVDFLKSRSSCKRKAFNEGDLEEVKRNQGSRKLNNACKSRKMLVLASGFLHTWKYLRKPHLVKWCPCELVINPFNPSAWGHFTEVLTRYPKSLCMLKVNFLFPFLHCAIFLNMLRWMETTILANLV